MSYEFDANTEVLNLGSAVVTAAPMTMSLWYYPYTVGSVQRRLGVIGYDAADHWNLMIETTDVPRWRARASSLNSDAIATSQVNDNQWNHCCGVEASSTSRFVWLNGVKSPENTINRSPLLSNETSIGNRKWVGSESPALGRIAHFAVWNIALSDSDVAALAVGALPTEVRPDALVVYESLLSGPGSFSVTDAVLYNGDGPDAVRRHFMSRTVTARRV